MPEEKITLENLELSSGDEFTLKAFTKQQRKALYDLCTIFHLTFYQKEERVAAERLRELIRKNTLHQNNVCEFDKTDDDRRREEWNRRVALNRKR